MAMIPCFYCDRNYLEQYDRCPHCHEKQMDIVQHAHILAGELRAAKVLQDKDNTEKLIKEIVLVPISKEGWEHLPFERVK